MKEKLFDIQLSLNETEIDLLFIIDKGNYVEQDYHIHIINNLCEKGLITHEIDITHIGKLIIQKIKNDLETKINNDLLDIENMICDMQDTINDMKKIDNIKDLDSITQRMNNIKEKYK